MKKKVSFSCDLNSINHERGKKIKKIKEKGKE